MKIHHIGIACKDIEAKIREITKLHSVSFCSDILFDKEQNAKVCLLEVNGSVPMELISGEPVNNLLKRGLTYYHIGYSINDIYQYSRQLEEAGAIQISNPKPALLFDNKLVAFFYCTYGLIELVEE